MKESKKGSDSRNVRILRRRIENRHGRWSVEQIDRMKRMVKNEEQIRKRVNL